MISAAAFVGHLFLDLFYRADRGMPPTTICCGFATVLVLRTKT